MRLNELYLYGFGHFHQQTIGPIEGPVTVFYGPNEAGKSTLLAFIRAVLFGFPARFNSHYPPLAGGRDHGGRIKLSNDTGVVYDVARYAGARGGLTVVTPGGPASDAAAEAALRGLTGAVTSDLFKNIFAFSLDELQTAASLEDSSIYSAGQGAPALPELIQSLKARKGKIYLSRGNNQEVPKLLNVLRGVDEQLKDVEGNAVRYGEGTARKLEIDRELADSTAELSRLNARRAEITSLQNGRDDWLAWTECEAHLRDMPRFEQFPENPIARLESLEERARQGREDLTDAAEQFRLAGEAATAPIPGEILLEDSASIEQVRRARSSFDASIRDLPERQAELRGLRADFDKNLHDLGHGWGEAELNALDTSMVVRNEVDVWKQRTAEALARSQQTQSRLEQDRLALRDHQEEAQEAREKLPPEPPPLDEAALTARQEALRLCRGRLDEYDRASRRSESLRDQVNLLTVSREPGKTVSGRPNPAITILLVLVGAATMVAAALLPDAALALSIGSGAAFLAAAALLLWGRRPSETAPSPMAAGLGQQAGEAESAADAARQLLVESAEVLGIAEQPDAAALDTEAARLETARSVLHTWTAATARVEEASHREKVQQDRTEAATLEHEAGEMAAQQAAQEWRQWLQERGLNQTLTADAMSAFFPSVGMTRSSLDEARRMGDRVAAIEHDIDQFREQVQPLAARHDIPLDPSDHRQLAAAADQLIKRLDETRGLVSSRDQARVQEDESRQRLERQEQRVEEVDLEITALLTAGEATNPEDFRRRARMRDEREELERLRDEHRRSLERISGPGDRFTAFRELLAISQPSLLTEEAERLSDHQAEVDTNCNALREERGGIDNALAQLTSEEESSALRIRRNTLLEQLHAQAREWSRLTIAEALLEKTRDKFERERQPVVIRHAQDFFSRVTGQRYDRVFARLGEHTISVTDATGASRQPSELSRGTREQLYLALRFGLIREFGEHAERLPVVVDEALVNFDPERARLAAESFAELSETNQVLVFTCHPATVETFVNAAQAQVVDISQAASQPG